MYQTNSSNIGCYTKPYYLWQWTEDEGYWCDAGPYEDHSSYGGDGEWNYTCSRGHWCSSPDPHYVSDSVTKSQWGFSSPHDDATIKQTVYRIGCGLKNGQKLGTINVNLLGGHYTGTPYTVTSDVLKFNIPVRRGKTFKGFTTSEHGDVVYAISNDTVTVPSSNLQLYAVWE